VTVDIAEHARKKARQLPLVGELARNLLEPPALARGFEPDSAHPAAGVALDSVQNVSWTRRCARNFSSANPRQRHKSQHVNRDLSIALSTQTINRA
jgi:hypothetical protein